MRAVLLLLACAPVGVIAQVAAQAGSQADVAVQPLRQSANLPGLGQIVISLANTL